MDVASGVIAVVSLGIQLAESVQKIRKFLRGIKEAPEELQRLIAKIDLLHDIFSYVNALIEQQRDMPSHHGLIPLFAGALRACETSVNRLESELARVQGLSNGPKESWRAYPGVTSKDRLKGSSRKRHALRSVLCKETVDSLCSIVDESLQSLNLVLSLNSNQHLLGNLASLRTIESQELTIQTLIKGSTAELSKSEDGQQTLVTQTQEPQASNKLSMNRTRSTISKYARRSYCRKLWGYVQFQEEVEYTHHESGDQEQTVMQLWSTRFTLPFLRTFLEWQLLRSYGQVSRSLRYYPRLADPMLYRPSFIGFHYEDPLKEALTRRELSPFAVDDEGKTLLHYAALYRNPELCSMLIRLGVNPEQRSINGYLPFGMLERVLFIRGSDIARDHVNLSTRSSDTARVLVNSQSDVEPADVQEFYKYYNGAPEGAEHVFSYDMSLSKTSDHERFQITPLHVALLHLGVSDDPSTFWQISHFEPEEWLYLVRKLLRGSVDLHAQCEELFAREWHHRTSQLLTPLQCLLLGSDNPFDGEYAAKTWLALLREAEYDQVAYLTQEMLIHAEDGLDLTEEMLIHTQDGLTDLDTWFQIPAGTRCFIGPRYQPATIMFVHLDPPRVWWDWFIEPGCKAYHVLHEFRNFNIHHETPRFRLIKQNMRYKQVDDWSQSWPFCYPNWAEESRPYPSSYNQELIAWKQRSKKARIRHARRAERTARKLTRSQ